MKAFFFFLVFLATVGSGAAADLSLAAPFADHAVLQAGMEVPVWGRAAAGESVSVAFAGQKKTTVADAEGRWRVVLDPLRAGHGGDMRVMASKQLTCEDVRVGEVWLVAGDAFLEKKLVSERSSRKELSLREFPPVRWFGIRAVSAREPLQEVSGRWVPVDPKTVVDFPAVAYFFAKELQGKDAVPVGIIQVSDPTPVTLLRGGKVTGSTVESWMSEATLRGIAVAKPIFDFYQSAAPMREALADYENALVEWKLKTGRVFGAELREMEKREPDVWYDYVAEMRKAGRPAPSDPPRKPRAESLREATTYPTNLYNGVIAPLAGVSLRGVVLNLGLGNAPRATQAGALLPALISDWRKAWGTPDLPFVVLQQGRASHPNLDPRALSELRAAQASSVGNTGRSVLVATLDLSGNGFPEDVQRLGERTAHAARAFTQVGASTLRGPVFDRVVFEGNKATVHFREGTRGLTPRDGGALRGFALAERPRRWAYADAKIEGNTVVVQHAKLRTAVALRYDWVVEPGYEGNLTDASGLPALPFRSDDEPAVTNTQPAMRPNAAAALQPADLFPVEDPTLPRVLLIGDSIMNGYSPHVERALKGRANVVRMIAFGMIHGNDASAAAFCDRLRDGEYSVIHYNDGLHSLPPRISDEQFGIGLSAMLKHLKTVAPHVIWATTTPAPNRQNGLGEDSPNPTVILRNAMSREIAPRYGVQVNDLYQCVIGERETLQGFGDLHFTPEGSKRMAEQIVREVLAGLAARSQ